MTFSFSSLWVQILQILFYWISIIFRSGFCSVIGQSSSHKLKDEKAQGILGGDKKLRCVLSNATKSSSVLTKAVVPKRVTKRDRDDDSSPERRTHARSRSHSQDKAKHGDRKNGRYSRKSSNSGNNKKSYKKSGGKSSKETKKPRSNSSKSKGNETFINCFFIVIFTLETKFHPSLSWPTPQYMHANANSRDLFLHFFLF